MNEDIAGWRQLVIDKRQSLREQYARLRKLGHIMTTKGWVTWNGKGHSYTASFLLDRNYKERETIKALFALQQNIAQQAMLLLELEHACDCEEQKRKEVTTDG